MTLSRRLRFFDDEIGRSPAFRARARSLARTATDIELHRPATDDANRQHVETGYGYIRWKLPDEPPKDLDLGPG